MFKNWVSHFFVRVAVPGICMENGIRRTVVNTCPIMVPALLYTDFKVHILITFTQLYIMTR